jgi:hypothetical protein
LAQATLKGDVRFVTSVGSIRQSERK